MTDVRQTAHSDTSLLKPAAVLRLRRPSAHGDVVWYEYAPIIDGAPQRLTHHMMTSPESAARLACQHGYEPADAIIDVTP